MVINRHLSYVGYYVYLLILGLRMIGYSYLQDPVHVYPYEALEGFTMALMMTSAVTYVAKISTGDTIASVMSLMGSLFFGIGKGSGSLFGGMVMAKLGSRWTFRPELQRRFFEYNGIHDFVATNGVKNRPRY